MNQFGKVVLFLFFVNYFVDKEEKIPEIGSNFTYGNMSLITYPSSDYNYYTKSYDKRKDW